MTLATRRLLPSRGSSRSTAHRDRRTRIAAKLSERKRRLILESLEQRVLLIGNPVIQNVAPLPAEGQSVSAAIDQLAVTVSEDLAAASANDTSNWSLVGAGPDDTFGTSDDIQPVLSLSSSYVSGTTVGLDIDGLGQVLQPGRYIFTASAGLEDLEGMPLDGNGDETGGDDFVTTFTVAPKPGESIETLSNNSREFADPLDMLQTPADSDYLRGIGLGSIQTGSDVDYWWFEAFAGDRVAIAVETPDNGMNPYVELRNSADGVLDSDDNDGANNDPLISYYTIASSGRYNVRVRSQSNSTGHYEVRVDQVRGTTQLESDAQYANALWAGPIGWPNILLVAWSRRQWPAQ